MKNDYAILKDLNAWWQDYQWYAKDPDIKAVESSRIKRLTNLIQIYNFVR